MKKLFLACLLVMFTSLSALAGVNINTANQGELQTIKGIGPSKAKAIISYRTQNGKFTNPAGIMSVKGIGPKLYEKIKNDIEVK